VILCSNQRDCHHIQLYMAIWDHNHSSANIRYFRMPGGKYRNDLLARMDYSSQKPSQFGLQYQVIIVQEDISAMTTVTAEHVVLNLLKW